MLLAHLLDGKRAVVITAPGAPSGVVNGITTALGDAGATVSGQVALSAKFADTSASNLSLLDQLTQRVAPSGLTLANGTPQQQAAQVLASALVSSGSSSGGSSGSGGSAVSGSGSHAGGQPGGPDDPVELLGRPVHHRQRPARPGRDARRHRDPGQRPGRRQLRSGQPGDRVAGAGVRQQAARPPWWPGRPPGRARAAPSRPCGPAGPRTVRPRWTTRMRSAARSLSFRRSPAAERAQAGQLRYPVRRELRGAQPGARPEWLAVRRDQDHRSRRERSNGQRPASCGPGRHGGDRGRGCRAPRTRPSPVTRRAGRNGGRGRTTAASRSRCWRARRRRWPARSRPPPPPGFRPGPAPPWRPPRPAPPRSAVTTTSPDRATGAGSAATSAPSPTAR